MCTIYAIWSKLKNQFYNKIGPLCLNIELGFVYKL